MTSWLGECEDWKRGTRSRDLYLAFTESCRQMAIHPNAIWTETRWGRRLTELGYPPHKRMDGSYRALRVKCPACTGVYTGTRLTEAQHRLLHRLLEPPFQAVTPQLQFRSPIEQEFWAALQAVPQPALKGLVSQHQVPGTRYRLDFALPDLRIGIELDGFASHSSTADIARDRRRQRNLEAAGWRVIRFGGAEIRADAAACVQETARLVRLIQHEREAGRHE